MDSIRIFSSSLHVYTSGFTTISEFSKEKLHFEKNETRLKWYRTALYRKKEYIITRITKDLSVLKDVDENKLFV